MKNPVIEITVKNFGKITAELYPEKAPVTVENFLKLVSGGFFEGLIFHRVISGFMIQGGGYDKNFKEKKALPIRGEFKANGCTTNDLRHTKGVLSMARTNQPDSASSQFFIMHETAPHLDGQYAGFGKVIGGIEIIDKIAAVSTGRYGYFSDVPNEPVIIEKADVINTQE